MTCRALDLDFAEIGAAVPDAANDVGTVVFGPGGGACQRMQEAPHVNPPRANVPIEIVLAVPFLGRFPGSGFCIARIRAGG